MKKATKAIIAILILLVVYWIFSDSGEDKFVKGMEAFHYEMNYKKANEVDKTRGKDYCKQIGCEFVNCCYH